jgi:branched-chain amino acid transport system substrate-binding protein
MKNKYAIIFISILILLILTTILIFNTNTPKKEIVIGVPLALTGNAASYGDITKSGFDLAVEEINKTNELKIKLIYDDTKGDPKEAVAIIKKQIDYDNINLFAGLIMSGEVLAVMPIINDANKILLNTYSSSNEISKTDFVFRNRETSDLHAKAITDYLIKNDLNKIVIFTAKASNSLAYTKSFKSEFESKGTVLNSFDYLSDNQDFSNDLIKIKELNPDAIYISPTTVKDAIQILKQINEFGIKSKVFSTPALDSPDFIQAKSDFNNEIYMSSAILDENNPLTKKFIENYIQKYNKEPSMFAANAYDAIYILYSAEIVCDTNTLCIKNYLETNTFDVAEGKIKFNEFGDVVKSVSIIRIN